MKVLILSWEYPPRIVGGLGQHVYDLSRFLTREGVAVHIITPQVENYPEYSWENGVHVHRAGHPYIAGDNFKNWVLAFNSEAIRAGIRANVMTAGFDVIHAHDWLAAYAGRALAKIFEIPLISTIHATEHGRNQGLHSRVQQEINEVEKNLTLDSDQVICCSNYMQQELHTLFGRALEEINVIPNGVDPAQFSFLPDNPARVIPDGEKAVFFLGRLVPEKGIIQLVRAFAQVSKRIPEACLYIGGSGPLRSALEQLIAELGLENRIFFTGFIRNEERNYLYDRASVAVFPSLYEPFGIVALEAMATQTPVIVGDAGGLAEIVEDGVNGLKVIPGDETGLAQAVIKVLTDITLAENLTRTGLNLVKSVYAWDIIARSTLRIYRNAVAQKKLEWNNLRYSR